MISVVTFVESLMDSTVHPLTNQRLLSIFLHLRTTPFCRTILQCIPTWDAFCGSGRIRTYSVSRQQIYSLSRLSNCGADPNFEQCSRIELPSRPWQGHIITVILTLQNFVIPVGLEPTTPTLKVLCSTCWAKRSNLAEGEGFEPSRRFTDLVT